MKILHTRFVLLICAAAAFGPSVAAELETRTFVKVVESDGRQARTFVDAIAHISLEQPPLLSSDSVIVTWQRVGGVQPTPFRVAIPAGCFVETRSGYAVNDTGCGVEVSLDDARVSLDSFAARLVPPEPTMTNELYRLRIRLDVTQDALNAGALLSTLGGATVTAQIGAERAVSPAFEILSKSGIDPTPF